MRAVRAIALGLLGLLVTAALAMGALALVRGGLDEPSDVGAFPALPPVVTASASATPPTSSPSSTATETASPGSGPSSSPSRTGGADHEGVGDDD